MSDRMHPIPFEQMLEWMTKEWKDNGTIFGCHKIYTADVNRSESFLGRKLETPIGPAAGPHTQLAQNIVSAYLCGGRFFELKTVQIIDGEDLVVNKPCILAEDEGYNCEWSTELTVQEAFEEYVKGWFLVHFLAKEMALGEQDGFVFNMSVGYDLEGIKSSKVDGFIENMKDASETDIFKNCKKQLLAFVPKCKQMTEEDVEAISPHIANNVTISTMHGCPAGEIEKIAQYLIQEKGLNLYLKCNPTLMGYEYCRKTLDDLNFNYIQFDREYFENDLQYEDAVPMLRRLKEIAKQQGTFFGVKLTNTFPVKVTKNELPDETMYMSGRTLLPISLAVAEKLSDEFEGQLPLSYCGGVSARNISDILGSGLYPVTVCTDLLKPGGYHRLNSMVLNAEHNDWHQQKVTDSQKLGNIAKSLCEFAKTSEIRRPDKTAHLEIKADCKTACGSCATLCPNRANVIIMVEGHKQMLHLDGLCNKCGNCASFCPEKKAPYLEKLTLFSSEEGFKQSANDGFFAKNDRHDKFDVRWKGQVMDYTLNDKDLMIDEFLKAVIQAVIKDYAYLMYR